MYGLTGRTVVLTGASSGIGRAAASALADAGAELFLVGRDETRLDDVARVTGGTPVRCDFENFASVRGAAATIAGRTAHIDVLINNAGAFFREHALTVDGNERTFQVNALAPFELTRALLPALAAANRPRVLFTSSELHRHGRSRLPDPNSPTHFNGKEFRQGTYSDSKFFAAVITNEFARRRPDIEWANFHPGIVHTNISRTMPILSLLQRTPLRQLMTITPERSAAALLAVLREPERYEATYFNLTRPDRSSEPTHDPALAGAVWAAAAAFSA